ncbi:MAG: hypothetical protein VKP62_05240, partial [Candidatus Sericytochromatia bacterium]|nr:hypothetical protein [Candidatus Sericytochromatia bacterium]
WSAKRFVGIFLHPPYHDALLSPADRESAEDFQALVAWERQQSQPTAVLVDAYPIRMWLYTKRKSVPYGDGATPSNATLELFRSRPCWIVQRDGYWGETPIKKLVDAHPDKLKLRFVSPHGHLKVYEPWAAWKAR